jgi:hypothetical protein
MRGNKLSKSMKPNFLLFILLFITLHSCTSKRNQNFEKAIIGEWSFVNIEDNRLLKNNSGQTSSYNYYRSGYIFDKNNKCENKLGYFKTIEGKEIKDNKTYYYGNTTKYKIENNCLKIYNLTDSSWSSHKIFNLVGDTLILQIDDSAFVTYVKTKYKRNPTENYDKIILSSSGCYGTCPIMDISIENNGNVLYQGTKFNTFNGSFTSKISSSEFNKIVEGFKKANLPNLDNNYKASTTDNEEISITFVKDNKIVKTITDYGSQAPTELFWAYTPLRYLYQHIPLNPLHS